MRNTCNNQKKKLTIVDFAHMSSRNLHSVVSQIPMNKTNGKYETNEFIQLYVHQMLTSLKSVKRKFQGEIILAMEGSRNWRKDYYSGYKGLRNKARDESPINYETFYACVEEFKEALKSFPFYQVTVDRAEADDIAGVVAKNLHKDYKITLVSSDKDWRQCTQYEDVQQWDPIKKIMVNLNAEERVVINSKSGSMCTFTAKHTLLGDAGDGVPKFCSDTEFSPVFLAYMLENGIQKMSPYEFHKLETSAVLIEAFNVYKKFISGKRKGQDTEVKDIYKNTQFGTVKVQKALDHLTDNTVLSTPHLTEQFERNNVLVDFNRIPEDVVKSVLHEFENKSNEYDPEKIKEYLTEMNLRQLLLSMDGFLDGDFEFKQRELVAQKSLDEWF